MASMQLQDIADQLQRLTDIEAIKQLKAEYVRLVDTQDWDAWSRLFTEDCHLDLDGGPIDGRDRAVEKVSKSLANAKTVHRLHAPEVTITGADTASAAWPMSDFVRGTFGGKELIISGHGYYYEDYVRTAEGWRVKRSQLVRQHVETSPMPEG
ncbi:SnoaL-like domain-containing protein [Novosphingobium sp. CF614]|uniref:nuclear transport factor 2 family protein n=1 Tax=Novosphingobium sp. CF614 TaxID=1884364 RepID=UPI0008F38CCA|nr:nuclear transport factor 2 family protein [Novosphingobium sp. CF614]SFG49076.1 SnoaL-like domain-containing protein [Novosphingobium sp. CF614]